MYTASVHLIGQENLCDDIQLVAQPFRIPPTMLPATFSLY
jgi:hypothetical protein